MIQIESVAKNNVSLISAPRWTLNEFLFTTPANRTGSVHPLTMQGQWPGYYFDVNLQTQTTKQTILNHFADKISFGSLSGQSFENIMQLPDTVYIDFDIVTFMSYDQNKLKQILKKYRVLITDLEEGVLGLDLTHYTDRGKTFVKHILNLKIIPRDVICVTMNLNLKDIDSLNIRFITMPYLLIGVCWATPWIYQAWENSKLKQIYLDRIEQRNREWFGMCPNFKPRTYRMYTLGYMHEKNVLTNTDWSLIGDPGNKMVYNDNDNSDFRVHDRIDEFKDAYNDESYIIGDHKLDIDQQQNFSKIVNNFISAHRNTLPKFMTREGTEDLDNWSFPWEYVGKYHWAIITETLLGYKAHAARGLLGAVTEKVYKAISIGAMPVMISERYSEDYVNSIGFKIHRTGHDELQYFNRIEHMIDHYSDLVHENIVPSLDDVMHNAEKMVDKEFICSTITKPILDILWQK